MSYGTSNFPPWALETFWVYFGIISILFRHFGPFMDYSIWHSKIARYVMKQSKGRVLKSLENQSNFPLISNSKSISRMSFYTSKSATFVPKMAYFEFHFPL